MNRIALRPFLKGCTSFIFPQFANSHKRGGTVDPRYCYAVFLRHYTLLRRFHGKKVPSVVAELGPGSSLGVGLAALLAGADRYVALDVVSHAAPEHDLFVFDTLVELFQRRSPIPTAGRYATLFPQPIGIDLPTEISMLLECTLDEKRLDRIRQAIVQRRGNIIDVAVPWTEAPVNIFGQVDWVFSHSVLEHVDNLEATYKTFSSWLRPQGVMTHLIDFYSHGLTSEWNGHWALGDLTWSFLRGRRSYLINRASRSQHIELLTRSGFSVLHEISERRSDGLLPEDLSERFRLLPEEDARTRMSFLVAKLDRS